MFIYETSLFIGQPGYREEILNPKFNASDFGLVLQKLSQNLAQSNVLKSDFNIAQSVLQFLALEIFDSLNQSSQAFGTESAFAICPNEINAIGPMKAQMKLSPIIYRFLYHRTEFLSAKNRSNGMEPTAGLEPATYALRMRCSTS